FRRPRLEALRRVVCRIDADRDERHVRRIADERLCAREIRAQERTHRRAARVDEIDRDDAAFDEIAIEMQRLSGLRDHLDIRNLRNVAGYRRQRRAAKERERKKCILVHSGNSPHPPRSSATPSTSADTDAAGAAARIFFQSPVRSLPAIKRSMWSAGSSVYCPMRLSAASTSSRVPVRKYHPGCASSRAA